MQLMNPKNESVKYLDGLLSSVESYEDVRDNKNIINVDDELCGCDGHDACKQCCVICYERVKSISINCGHIFCYKCIKDAKKCHICNEKISTFRKIYLN